MLKSVLGILLAMMLMLFCVCGCGKAPGLQTEQEKTALDLQTCGISGKGMIEETQTGYYARFGELLCYADKTDLENWVPVCDDPSCEHDDYCKASLLFGFFIDDGRIYTVRDTTVWEPEEDASCYAVYSMNLDGSDHRKEHEIAGSMMDNGGGISIQVGERAFYACISMMQTDGKYRNLLVRATSNESVILYETQTIDYVSTILHAPSSMRGDYAIYDSVMSPSGESSNGLRRLSGDSAEVIPDILDYDLKGAFLKGNLVYRFEQNSGYYITDISSGRSEKWMDPQLQDSYAYHIMPDYIVESNLHVRYDPADPKVLIFNGEEWKNVTLPENFWPSEEAYFYPVALSTEHMFFRIQYESKTYIYSVALSDNEYTMSLCTMYE